MPSKSNVTYQGLVNKARNSRFVNIGLCSVAVIIILSGIIFTINTEFLLPAMLCAFMALLALTAVAAKSFIEAKAALRIANNAVYAARLTAEQQRKMKKHQMRRGQIFYLTVLLLVVMPEAAVLTAMYFFFDSSLYLLIMAAFALFCLLCAFVALAYLSARLSANEAICSISKYGVIFGREILPFSVKKKEAIQLLKFRDYYLLVFVKTAVAGVKYESSLIFPIDGVVRNDLTGTPDEELVCALGLDGIFETEDAFYESRDYLTDDGAQEQEASPEKAAKQKNGNPKSGNKKAVKNIYSENNTHADAVIEPVDEGSAKKGMLE